MVSPLQNDNLDNVTTGAFNPATQFGDYNNQIFLIQQALLGIETATLVRVMACSNNDEVSSVGFVDVVPMVHQIDSKGVPTPHTTIYNVPYFRAQGGKNAIIIDPKAGDIGICCFASRDITKVKNTRKENVPGSLRNHSFSDGLYIGGVLNGVPEQYIRFFDDGITIHSPNLVRIEAPKVEIECKVLQITADDTYIKSRIHLDGTMDATGDITSGGISAQHHTHGNVFPGNANTGQPQ